MTPSDLESILAVIGALSVLLGLICNLPGVKGSKFAQGASKLLAIDIIGVLRVVGLLLAKKPEQKPPSDE